MRTARSLLLAVAILAFAAPFVRAAEEKKTKTGLDDQMENIDEAMSKLRRTIRKAELNNDSLKLLTDLQQAAVACKAMVPAKAAKLPESQRAPFIAAYRKDMAELVISLSQMEIAILNGDNTKAQDIYKQLKTMEDKGHDKYKEEEQPAPKK